MNRIKRSFALGVIFWGATNLSQISQAQYWVPIQPPVPRHDTMFPRRDRSINNTPSNTPRQEPNSSTSGTYRLKSKDIFTFTNQEDPKVATGQYANFSGNYSGKYSLPFIYNLGIPIKATLTLYQNGNQIAGTLETEADRRAEVQGTVQGSQLVGKLIFNDSCAGEGSLIGDLSSTGDLMTGKFRVSDCNGKYGGRYKVKRSASSQ
jgi:hypothetical protein